MPQILAFVYGRLCIQEVLIIHAIIHKGINSEVAHTERSQILEEVGPLAGIYAIIRQSGFHNDAGGTDMWPFYRNTQPCVTATLTSGPNENIIPAFIKELLVQFLYFPGNLLIV